MCTYYPESKVEIKGFIAKHYDALLNIFSFNKYPSLIQKSIKLMKIKPNDKILDLGAGTGRNACLIMKYLSTKGELIGFDISDEMTIQFKKKCINYPNAKIIKRRIDKDLRDSIYKESFDKVFISFVLHGFPQEIRKKIIRNALKALKKGGKLFILDYNKFSLKGMPFYLKIPFKIIECPYAFDFIEKDWEKILAREGFNHLKKHLFFSNYVRLLEGKKK